MEARAACSQAGHTPTVPFRRAGWGSIAVLPVASLALLTVTEPLLGHMRLASEIAVPTVCAACVLITALLLTLLLRHPR